MAFNQSAAYVLQLPRLAKQAVVMACDALLIAGATWFAFGLRLDAWWPVSQPVLVVAGLSVVLALPIFVVMGLYRAIFRFAGLDALTSILRALAIYTAFFAALIFFAAFAGVPRSIGIIQALVLGVLVVQLRLFARFWLGGLTLRSSKGTLRQVLIFGAGAAGRQLASAMVGSTDLRIVGYLDDDDRLHGQTLNGIKIYDPQQLVFLTKKLAVTDVFLALPSVSRKRRNSILALIRQSHVRVKTLPDLSHIANGHIHSSDLRELDIEDLLGREPVPPNPLLLGKNTRGKVVMVTGAGGSIGSELCRQILQAPAQTLLLVELNEFALYTIHQELEASLSSLADKGASIPQLIPLLANVRDASRMAEIMRQWQPHTLYHAAAYKHVPLVEGNAAEGIRNNVWGTFITAQQALLHGVADFVLISTDKAVRPTNVMGASKRLAEMVLQALAHTPAPQRVAPTTNHNASTRFSMVRFGNVLGSSGSVVPLFRQQIAQGGPITLTDPRITRYLMTIPEAAQLVIQAGAMATGGDVFLLDMGEPIKIADLAQRMVELSGLSLRHAANPQGDIAIEVTGLRPGEKLYEELLIADNPMPTSHRRIMKAHEDFLPMDALQTQLNALSLALDNNQLADMRQLLTSLVAGYTYETNPAVTRTSL